jgi:hypothetical protein
MWEVFKLTFAFLLLAIAMLLSVIAIGLFTGAS